MKDLELLVTLWPTFPHFKRFAQDNRLAGIRLNSAMIELEELGDELQLAQKIGGQVPLYFDVKARQLRVAEVIPNSNYLELILNHPISVKTPTEVLFKAGEDCAVLDKVKEGKHLIFQGGPHYKVKKGESLHIRHPSLEVGGSTFADSEIPKIEKAKAAGFDKFFMSYVESQRDIDAFRELVGDAYIIAKIENNKGLNYVAKEYVKKDNLALIAACGDLYVEIGRPHEIMGALKLIIEKDPQAYVGSRMLLSVIHSPVPSFADLLQLSWLYDTGYKRMMLCDELCLKEDLLGTAVNVFESFRETYAHEIQEQMAVEQYVPMVGKIRMIQLAEKLIY